MGHLATATSSEQVTLSCQLYAFHARVLLSVRVYLICFCGDSLWSDLSVDFCFLVWSALLRVVFATSTKKSGLVQR